MSRAFERGPARGSVGTFPFRHHRNMAQVMAEEEEHALRKEMARQRRDAARVERAAEEEARRRRQAAFLAGAKTHPVGGR